MGKHQLKYILIAIKSKKNQSRVPKPAVLGQSKHEHDFPDHYCPGLAKDGLSDDENFPSVALDNNQGDRWVSFSDLDRAH